MHALSRARRRAFTLIELLVVITIIVVLAGILMPAVFSVSDSGQRVQCMEQLRQIGMALSEYERDHGHYPAAGGRGFLAELHRRGAIEDSRGLVCPLSDEAQVEGWEVRGARGLAGKPGDPVPDGAISYWGRKGGAKSIRAARAKRIPASQIPVACDGLSADAEGVLVSPHGHRLHVLYLDGHVEAIPTDEFLADTWNRLGEHPRKVLGP